MVSIKKIEQIFTKILNAKIKRKCKSRFITGKKSSFNTYLRKGLYDFKDKHKNDTKENVGLLNNKGELLLDKECQKDSWSLTLNDLIKAEIRNEYNLHLTHTHITPIQGDDEHLGNPTCLSKEDIESMLSNFHFRGEIVYRFKSITAECLNNSRMTLERNVDTFNHKDFKKAINNLTFNWDFYLMQSNDEIDKRMLRWIISNDINNLSSEAINNHRIFEEEKYAQEHFMEYISENIDEFKKIGFDLSMEWVK